MFPITGGGAFPARIARTDLSGNPVSFGHRLGTEPMFIVVDRLEAKTVEALRAALTDIERVLADRKTLADRWPD